MIIYNPKQWLRLIFQFHPADTARKLLPAMLAVGFYTAIFSVVELEYVHFQTLNTTAIHSLLGIVISLLLVFRTNSAYDRWWEGRKLWGSLVNTSRNIAMKWSVMIDPQYVHLRGDMRKLLTQFPLELKEHLRSNGVGEHRPNTIASGIIRLLHEAYSRKIITGDQLIILNPEVTALTDITGGCERIRSTPIPYSYNIFVKKFIFFYTATLPYAFVESYGYSTILLTMFIFYALASLELVAEEIEDPFGLDANDLSTDELAEKIGVSVRALIQ